jgi:hypothetical protein
MLESRVRPEQMDDPTLLAKIRTVVQDEASERGCGMVIYVLGMCIAVVVSWEVNRSLIWASIDGLLSWAYIFYHFYVST